MKLHEFWADYKEQVEKGDPPPIFAHEILYEALTEDGVDIVDDKWVRLPSLERAGIYGIYPTITGLYQFIRSAKEGFDSRKRLLVFVGPPASAKSSLVSAVKLLLEEYTKTHNVPAIKDCPVHDNPLFAIPWNIRNELRNYGITIENEILPCPVCRRRIKEEGWENLEVEFIQFDRSFEIGFGEYAPQDPNTADDSLLIGKMSYSKMAKYGDNDPRAWDYSGVFQKGNRGIVEFVEILKAKIEHLYMLLTASQDQKVVLGKNLGPMYLDLVIIGHTNAPEFEEFSENPKNAALKDRMIIVPANYNLDTNVEEKVLKKLVPVSKNKISDPLIFKAAAYFTVATRIFSEKQDVDISTIIEKLKWENKSEEAYHTRNEVITEGMGVNGLSSRQMANLLVKIYTSNSSPSVVDLLDRLDVFVTQLEDQKTSYELALSSVREFVASEVKDLLIDVFISGSEEDVKNMFQTFLKNLQAMINKEDHVTIGGKKYPIDKEIVQKVVSAAGFSITDEELKDIYLKITTIMSDKLTSGEPFDLKKDIPFLYKAIKKVMFREKVRLIGGTLNLDIPVDELKGIARQIIDSLVENYGFSKEGAQKLVKYASDLLKEEVS